MKKKLSILLLAGMMIMTVAGIGMAGTPDDTEIGNPAMAQEQLLMEDAECDGDCDGDMLQTQTRQQLRDGSGDGDMVRKQERKQLKKCDGTGLVDNQ